VTSLDFPTTASGYLGRRFLRNAGTARRKRVKIDGRSHIAKRLADLTKRHLRAIGQPPSRVYWHQRCRELAQIELLAEEMMIARLNGESISAIEIARIANLLDRKRRGLGLATPPAAPAEQSLSDVLRGRKRRSGR
jgi:hypothetical protein